MSPPNIGARDILLVEDDERFGAIAKALLEAASYRVEWARSGGDARRLVSHQVPRAAVVDLGLPDCDGVELVRELAMVEGVCGVLALTAACAPSTIVDVLRAGASGYLFKEDFARRLAQAVDELLEGGAPMSAGAARAALDALRGDVPEPLATGDLTTRERDVLRELSRGLTYTQVGEALDLSANTVRSHVRNLYRKLGAVSRTEAILAAAKKP